MILYKVQFSIYRRGYKRKNIEGICQYPDDCKKTVTDMKRETKEFIRAKLSERNDAIDKFNIEVKVFKRLKTDFMYCSSSDPL